MLRFARRLRLTDTMEEFEFTRYVVPLRDRMFRYAQSLLLCADEAEDVTHDLLERLWRERDRLDGCRDVASFVMVPQPAGRRAARQCGRGVGRTFDDGRCGRLGGARSGATRDGLPARTAARGAPSEGYRGVSDPRNRRDSGVRRSAGARDSLPRPQRTERGTENNDGR